MFKNNKKQYINIIKQDKQLKIDYRILQNNSIFKQENSSFILQKDTLSQDIIFKLETLQSNIPFSYLSTLSTSNKQSILKKENIDTTKFNTIKINENYSVAIPKNSIEDFKNYFQKTGIDYILSPFSILNELIISNGVANSLNILVYDNKLFVIILDKNSDIKYSTIKDLTPFENIKDSNFYNDEIIGQKLYDEVYFLEIQQLLSEIIENYYSLFEGVDFLNKVDIFYTIKQLNDEQQDILHENLMLEVSYEPINIDNHLYILTQRENNKEYSFIEAREKKNNTSILLWLAILLFSIILVGSVLYYKLSSNDTKKIEVIKSISKEDNKTSISKIVKPDIKPIIKKETIVKLPNHTEQNNKVVQHTLMLFDIIPYDAVLKELQIKKDSSTFVSNFVSDSNSTKTMKKKLLKVYKESKTILNHQNKAILSTIISNNNIYKKDKKPTKQIYKKHKFKYIADISKYLGKIAIKDSKIKLINQSHNQYTTYTFNIQSKVKTPKEFFDFIENLNKKQICLNLVYPLEFAKIKDHIAVDFNIQFHQPNKKTPIKQ
ncbi:MAG: hypothetical protein U9O56_03620 [Campylobacterota bacterium]|nr:hypothetical protein [Campylobacterota bacterium]